MIIDRATKAIQSWLHGLLSNCVLTFPLSSPYSQSTTQTTCTPFSPVCPHWVFKESSFKNEWQNFDVKMKTWTFWQFAVLPLLIFSPLCRTLFSTLLCRKTASSSSPSSLATGQRTLLPCSPFSKSSIL